MRITTLKKTPYHTHTLSGPLNRGIGLLLNESVCFYLAFVCVTVGSYGALNDREVLDELDLKEPYLGKAYLFFLNEAYCNM